MNNQLRDHVTSGAFTLTLRKTHIAALVWLHDQLERDRTLGEDIADRTLRRRPTGRVWSHFATGAHGLQDRGLIQHIHYLTGADQKLPTERRPSESWRITEAGQLVVGLLKECGLWDEYATELPEVTP